MEKLLAGYLNFRDHHWPKQSELFESLAARGQKPKALVISCVDSRVDPAVVFDAAPGEILTVRNVANLVPPYEPDIAYHGTSAALEFGVRVLEIPHLVVLGHSSCGGVQALLHGLQDNTYDFIAPWMAIAASARKKALACVNPAEQQQQCEHEAIKLSLDNLMTFPWIAERVKTGKLTLYGMWFSIGTGALKLLQPDGSFKFIEDLKPR